jgi:hypothetical protein
MTFASQDSLRDPPNGWRQAPDMFHKLLAPVAASFVLREPQKCQ